MTEIEEYAVYNVGVGARSYAEDDINEEGELSDANHRIARELELKMARAINSNPESFLGWFRSVTL